MKVVGCFFLLSVLLVESALASWYEGATGRKVKEEALYGRLHSGQVLLLSEQHGLEPHHQNQRDILVNISGASFPLSVGMEFFDYTQQPLVDEYVASRLAEEDFLKQIQWGRIPFANYRFQVRFPHFFGGHTLALNLPRSLSGKIAQNGLDALSDEERALLPPDYEMGQESYYERFRATMKDHATEEQMKNYFAAQSLWDETMAWTASEYMQKNPRHLLVIIVGDFHVAYQDGLVARLKARGVRDIVSVSQADTRKMSDEERVEVIQPHPRYGARADFIFDVK